MDGWRYYGQMGEDFLLAKYFEFRRDGFFLDVGAFDGVHLSNSYMFEKLGWQGICVEPSEVNFSRCRSARPNSICVRAACVSNEDIQHVEFSSEPLGLLSGISVDEADIRRRYARRGLDYPGLSKISVPAKTLNAILAEYAPGVTQIQFLSIDVEGTELDVLAGLDFDRFRPEILVVEANDEESKRAVCESLVKEKDYFFGRQLGVNLFFARYEKGAERLAAMRGTCKIARTHHPDGEEFDIELPKKVALGRPWWRRLLG